MSKSGIHHFERNIVEIKKEYTEFLITILSPFIYEGFQSLYTRALENEKLLIEKMKTQSQIQNPGSLSLFQTLLKGTQDLNDDKITKETNRIRDLSGCADYFDNLIKAVIKSNIVLLTYNASEKECKLVNEKFHQNVDIKAFIHKCYIECARIFYDHVDLFWREYNSVDIKHNQRVIYQLVKIGIVKAIRYTLPMKAIIDEYLRKDYIEIADDKQNFKSLRDMLRRDMGGDEDLGGTAKILMTSDDEKYDTKYNDDDLLLGDDTMLSEVPEKMKEFLEIVEKHNVPESNQNALEIKDTNAQETKDTIVQETKDDNGDVKHDSKEIIKDVVQSPVQNIEMTDATKTVEKKMSNSFREDNELSNVDGGNIMDRLLAGTNGKRSKKFSADNYLLDAIRAKNNNTEIKIFKPSVDRKDTRSEIKTDNGDKYFENMMK